jgi:hypothetical protein
MSKQQFYIEHPLTRKKIVVSRDAYNAFETAIKVQQEKNKEAEQKVKEVQQVIASKIYLSELGNVKVATRFDEKGAIKIDDTQIEFTGSLAEANESELVGDAILSLLYALNVSLNKRAEDANNKVKTTLSEAA